MADVTAGVERGLLDRSRVDALELIGRHRVQDDAQPEVLLEGFGVEQVAALAEGDSEQPPGGLDQQGGGRRGAHQAAEATRHVWLKVARPARWMRVSGGREQRVLLGVDLAHPMPDETLAFTQRIRAGAALLQ